MPGHHPKVIPAPQPHPRHPAGSHEPYSCPCPRCGYPETQDHGPYAPDPFYDMLMDPPYSAEVHLMTCGRCGKPFDAGPDAPSNAPTAS